MMVHVDCWEAGEERLKAMGWSEEEPQKTDLLWIDSQSRVVNPMLYASSKIVGQNAT